MTLEKIVFGTYTKRVSKGVYTANLDTTTGLLQDTELLVELGSPTYTTLSQAHKLYAVDKRDGQGGIAVVDFATQQIEQSVMAEGASPAYLAVDEARQLLYSGNYHKGTVEVYAIATDGQITQTDAYQSVGSGPRPEQGSSHVHFTNLTPDNRLVVVDLGADQVLVFDVSAAGKLSLASTFKTEAGFGPRHIRFSPDGQYAYLLGELSSLLSVLKYDQATGTFELLETVTTIPAEWTEHNGAAALRVSKDGRFVYASNRGHNSIAVFAVSEDGAKVERVQLISTEGDFPRDFALNATEEFVVAGNQNTDNVSLYRRDAATGLLTLTQKDYAIPETVRVEFIS
ncbi:MAG: lactonase family protein [Lactobacillaceae bacterium]|jgi:6-phosphogluconolactonase|nr:lactonase family protein [Lactobacillaceae bacterium]